MKYNIFTPAKPSPIALDWVICLEPHNPSGSIRVVAKTPEGKRILDGNLVKFKSDGTVYRYHTVNPGLGFSLDRDGRINLE